MITKMTKYSMILLSGDLDSFLSGIQSLGMVDITRSAAACDDASKQMQMQERCGLPWQSDKGEPGPQGRSAS